MGGSGTPRVEKRAGGVPKKKVHRQRKKGVEPDDIAYSIQISSEARMKCESARHSIRLFICSSFFFAFACEIMERNTQRL